MKREICLVALVLFSVFFSFKDATATVDYTLTSASSAADNPQDYVKLSPITATLSGTLSSIGISLLPTATGNLSLGIYSDNSGSPNALLSNSSSVIAVSGWNDIPLSGVSINAGSIYWVGVNTNNVLQNELNISVGVSKRAFQRVWIYPNFTNPFGGSGDTYGAYYMRMTYVPVPPLSYSNNKTSNPANYDGSTKSWFNATWNDTIPSATLEINATGSLVNYTMNLDSINNVSYSNFVMPAGTFKWRINAPTNSTSFVNFTIGNGTASSNVYLNNLTTNQSVNYPNTIEIRGNSTSYPSPSFKLYVKNVTTGTEFLLGSSNPTISSIQLGNGTWNIIYNTTGNSNYTNAQNNSLFLLVSKGIQTLTILSNVTSPINYPTSSNVTGTNCNLNGIGSDVTCTLYRGAVMVGTGNNVQDNILLGVGTYKYNYSSTSGANWTSSSASNYTLTVNIGNALGLTYNPANIVVEGTTSTITGTNCPPSFTCNLYRNDILATNPDIETLSIGTYNYIYNTSTSDANFTSNSASGNLIVLPAPNPIPITPTIFTNITTVFMPNSTTRINASTPINWTVSDSGSDFEYSTITINATYQNGTSVQLFTQTTAISGTTIGAVVDMTSFTGSNIKVLISFKRSGYDEWNSTFTFYPMEYYFPAGILGGFPTNVLPNLIGNFFGGNGTVGIFDSLTSSLIIFFIAFASAGFVAYEGSKIGVPSSISATSVFVIILALFASFGWTIMIGTTNATWGVILVLGLVALGLNVASRLY